MKTFFSQKDKVPEPVSSEPIIKMATEIEDNVNVELFKPDCANATVSDVIFETHGQFREFMTPLRNGI